MYGIPVPSVHPYACVASRHSRHMSLIVLDRGQLLTVLRVSPTWAGCGTQGQALLSASATSVPSFLPGIFLPTYVVAMSLLMSSVLPPRLAWQPRELFASAL